MGAPMVGCEAAAAGGGPSQHSMKNPDQYLTPVGQFLRKTSLDELP